MLFEGHKWIPHAQLIGEKSKFLKIGQKMAILDHIYFVEWAIIYVQIETFPVSSLLVSFFPGFWF